MTHRSTSIQMIPLNKLVPSPRNVRRIDRKAEIDSLAASIASRGLLQNLCVVAVEDKFEVDAGGRRLAALKKLARDKVIAKDHPVPCHVIGVEEGREVSLMENIHRVRMDAMDEVDAYAALVAEGLGPDEVAHRFGVTRRHVDQRLALSGLSPKIKVAWKRGDITLDAARAFCLVADHGQQEAVFRSLGRPVTHAASVRARLMDGRMRTTDRLVTFVGLDAYEAAGGKVLRDLFDDEAAFIECPALLTKLAEDKLEASRARWLQEGWSWVDVALGRDHAGLASIRLHPEWRDPTPEEQTELDCVAANIEKLDAELEDNGVDDDARWTERDSLEAAYETIRQAGRFWSPEAKQLAGVRLSIDYNGSMLAVEGLVRSEDQKRAEAFLKKARAGASGETGAESGTEPESFRTSRLPKAINRELTLVRTRAIRHCLAGHPDAALALCVAAMLARMQRLGEMPGVGIVLQPRLVGDLPQLDESRAALAGEAPSEVVSMLDWTLGLSRARLLDILALAVASSVDLAHEDATPADREKQDAADILAQHLDIDMRQYWKADADYWARLPKAVLLEELAESPGIIERDARGREDALKSSGKLRKGELAAKVFAAFEGTGYLPDILVTPIAAGALEITASASGETSLPAVAAE